MRTFASALALAICLAFGTPAVAAEELPEEVDRAHPLRPPDTSSPRATLRTFLDGAGESWRAALERGRRTGRTAEGRRAQRCLNLTEVPPAQREDLAREVGIMLYDVFNRVPLPRSSQVPDADQMQRQEQSRWVVPDTDIAIARVEDGERAGEWLFTPRTVRNTKTFYRLTRHLPLKRGAVVEDGYRIYIALAGWMIPVGLVASLPDWAHRVYFEQTVWQWAFMAVSLALAGVLAWYGMRWSRGASSGERTSAGRALAGPLWGMLVARVTLYAIDEQLHITGSVLAVLRPLLDSAFYLFAAWGTLLGGRLVARAIADTRRIARDPLNAQLVRMSVRLASFVVIFVVLVEWARSLGIPVVAMLTGFGVGGIAVALAAQRTVENFIGSLTLFADRPVRVGDFCVFGDKMGTVEHIGMRSTRIRTLQRSLLTIPNAEFSRLQLDNLAHRDRMLFQTHLNLRLETTPEQIDHLLTRIRELLREHDRVHPDPARVELVAVGPLSVDLEIFSYVLTREMNEFLRIRGDIFTQILREVEAAGTALAPPAQTTYVRSGEAAEERAEDEARDRAANSMKSSAYDDLGA